MQIVMDTVFLEQGCFVAVTPCDFFCFLHSCYCAKVTRAENRLIGKIKTGCNHRGKSNIWRSTKSFLQLIDVCHLSDKVAISDKMKSTEATQCFLFAGRQLILGRELGPTRSWEVYVCLSLLLSLAQACTHRQTTIRDAAGGLLTHRTGTGRISSWCIRSVCRRRRISL